MPLLHVYDLTLEAFGGGVLEDADFGCSLTDILHTFRLEHGRDPIDVSYVIEDTKSYDLDYWFTAVAPGYLERLPTLKELVLPGTVESVGLTLVFRRDGTACIREDIDSPGSSASHSFGWTFFHELPRAFYRVKTAEQIAGEFSDVMKEAILEDGRLADFIARAKEKDKRLFWGKNRW